MWTEVFSISEFIIQSFVVFILILTSVVCIILSRGCEKKTVWVALLSSVVGFTLPILRYSFKMKKKISQPTEDRVSMSMVGPAASGKSHLNFQMLKKGTFVPAFDKNFLIF